MKKFIPLRKVSTVLIVLSVIIIGPYAFQHLYMLESPIASVTKRVPPVQEGAGTTAKKNANDSWSYGVVVDCGSSGSRVFVYYWEPHPGLPNHLLDIKILKNASNQPVIHKIKPGLSSLHKQTAQASNYISPLLEFAAENIPKNKVKETPLYIFATAGLRLLSQEDQNALLNDLRMDIGLDFDFIFYKSHVEVISGEDEAIYAWTAVNQALGKFSHKLDDDPLIPVDVSGKIHVRKRTVGVLDLGGASLQMALELPQTYSVYDPRIKNHVFEFNLGCTSEQLSHKYKVYARTFLGRGSDRTRSNYVEWLVGSHNNLSSAKTGSNLTISDPCLSVSSTEKVISSGIAFWIIGSGELDECMMSLQRFLNKSVDCLPSNQRRCSIDGVVLPDMNFRNVEFYGFSEFFYTMQDVFEVGGPYTYHYFKEKAEKYCSTDWSVIESWKKSSRHPRADAERYRLQCFKSAWVLQVLHSGLNFPSSYRHLTSIQYLDGYEVHWSLGAIIHKTKYFPLRDMERLSTSRLKSPVRLTHLLVTPPWSVVILLVLFLSFMSSICCIHFLHPFDKRRGSFGSVGGIFDFDERSGDPKVVMVRSRSYGVFES